MSIQIKSLTNVAPVRDNSLGAVNEPFNIIPTANDVYSLYTASSASGSSKTAVVKGIRLVNTHTAAVSVNLYFNRPSPSGFYRRRLLAPPNLAIPAGGIFTDDGEITLEPGDSIQAKADTANVIHYLLSGVERDVL